MEAIVDILDDILDNENICFRTTMRYCSKCALDLNTISVKHLICPCKEAKYCSKSCLEKHWNDHGPVCKYIKEKVEEKSISQASSSQFKVPKRQPGASCLSLKKKKPPTSSLSLVDSQPLGTEPQVPHGGLGSRNRPDEQAAARRPGLEGLPSEAQPEGPLGLPPLPQERDVAGKFLSTGDDKNEQVVITF